MKSTLVDRFNYISDDKLQLAIPIGPRFQADVPEWRGPPYKNYPHGSPRNSDSSKWLGTLIWSTKNSTPVSEGDVIGKGRPASCNCATPGSILCVEHHVTKKSANLLNNLGPAFQKWKFDQMGETIAKLWKQPEQQRLTDLIIKCALSGDDFLKPALECFPRKSKKDIVSYYFNVHVPRRMGIQTRSGCTKVDTDDEKEQPKRPCSNGSKKRARVDGITGYSSKIVNTRYLTGRR